MAENNAHLRIVKEAPSIPHELLRTTFINRSSLTQDHADVFTAMKKFIDAGGNMSAMYAAVMQQRVKDSWASRFRLKLSDGHCCVQRLLGKQCRRYSGDCACNVPGHDHATLWTRDGKPVVYVSQPYNFSLETMGKTHAFCIKHGLNAYVSEWPSWHYPGSILSVIVTKVGVSHREVTE